MTHEQLDNAANEGRPDTYEGWSNRETWSIANQIDNDEACLDYWTAQARIALLDVPATRLLSLVDTLRDAFVRACEETDAEESYVAPFILDLAECALLRVNWSELAEHYLVKARDRADAKAGRRCGYVSMDETTGAAAWRCEEQAGHDGEHEEVSRIVASTGRAIAEPGELYCEDATNCTDCPRAAQTGGAS